MRTMTTTILALLAGMTVAASFEVVSPSEARYRVRERVLGVPLANDAVGITGTLSGSIVLEADGDTAVSGEVNVDLTGLVSDQPRRDAYVHEDALETERYPSATFSVSEVRGLPRPPPTDGEVDVVIAGQLTVRNFSLPISWSGTASFDGADVHLDAATTLTFEELGLERPRVGVLVTVSEEITLEVSILLRRR